MEGFEGSVVDAYLNEIRNEALRTNANQGNTRGNNQRPSLNPLGVKEDELDENSDFEDEALQKIIYEDYDMPFQYTGYVVRTTHEDTVIWYDTSVGKRPCYRLRHLSSYEAIDALGDETFSSLKTDMCPRDVGKLMLLAYNLVGPDDMQLFGRVDPSLIEFSQCMEFVRMNDTPLRSAQRVRFSFEISEKGDDYASVRIRAIGYCYLAASYLRLYTKSAENYTRIGDHLKKRFKNFYATDLPFSTFHPDKETVISIKSIIETHETLRNTFYNFIYAGELVVHGKSLKEFLYSMHVTLTGMHAYQLFLKCMSAYKCTNAELTKIFTCPKFESELKAITFIFSHLFKPGEGRELQMWRFSRIFDPKYLSALQTKNCVIFTYALAVLYKNGTTKMDGTNVFKIVQLENISNNDKVTAEIVGIRAKFLLDKEQYTGAMRIVPAAKRERFRKKQKTATA